MNDEDIDPWYAEGMALRLNLEGRDCDVAEAAELSERSSTARADGSSTAIASSPRSRCSPTCNTKSGWPAAACGAWTR